MIHSKRFHLILLSVCLLVGILSAETISAEKKAPETTSITRSPDEGITPTETDRSIARDFFSEAQRFSKEKNPSKAFLSALRCLDEIHRWKESSWNEKDRQMEKESLAVMKQMSIELKKSYISDDKINRIRY